MHYYKKLFFLGISFFMLFGGYAYAEVNLAYINSLPREWEGTFNGKDGKVTFVYHNGKANFSYHDFKAGERFFYGDVLEILPQDNGTSFECEYYIDKPLDYSAQPQNPKKVDPFDLADFVKTKKVVFYTGAGISIDGGVYGMEQLVKVLKLHDYNEFKMHAENNSEEILHAFKKFCYAAFENSPTRAHYALAQLCTQKELTIITENFDLLHERAGSKPLKCEMTVQGFNYEQIKKEVLDKDVVICIGLSHDDRGLLAWYKKNNPDGVILALDLQQPSYLSDKDMLIQGNLQTVLSEVLNVYNNKENL